MEYCWSMEDSRRDVKSRTPQGRGNDFVGGIDNEGLDFSQLEAFINSDGTQSNGNYFGDPLSSSAAGNSSSSGKLLNVIVENKRPPGHPLPDSPPDSSSEHPYSPQDTCEPSIATSEAIYTTLGQPMYKPSLLNPILSDNLILGSHIVIADQNSENDLLDGDIMVNGSSAALQERMLFQESTDSNSRPMMMQTDTGQNYGTDSRPLLLESCPRRAPELHDKSTNQQMVHMGFDVQLPNQNDSNNMDDIQAVYTNLQNAPKKRKLSQDMPLVKSEPEHCSPGQLSPPGPLSAPIDDDFTSESCLSEPQYQCIRFNPFQPTAWHTLCDQNLSELLSPHYRVDADKGFNFSNVDDAFVCQKKNHFQITCHVQLLGDAQFVKTSEGFQKISSFHLHFYGVKFDCPSQTIRVEQSQSDRSKKPFHPVLVELANGQVTKVTVGRLHFSETTSNNMRKKGKPNPEQRYFQLVVGLHAHTSHGNFPIVSHASQKIIVRASNPGQFENDVELCWQKGHTNESIFHAGKVGINTDRPDESLVVHGNLKITGHIIQPSDIRAKKNIVECDTAQQLRNVQRLRVVKYEYEPEFAAQLNRRNRGGRDTGVIAQEVAQVLPEAVSPAGDFVLDDGTAIDNFLVVNKERIFMENIGAVKELCRVTDNLETRIDQLERINRKLTKLKSASIASAPKKCYKSAHCGHNKDAAVELCSNKFIQVVIVVLVLVMAFCLIAITTLYLMEAARHSQLAQANMHRSISGSKAGTNAFDAWHEQSRFQLPRNTIKQAPSESPSVAVFSNQLEEMPAVLGRPPDCTNSEQLPEMAISEACQVFCCPSAVLDVSNRFYGPISRNKTVSVSILGTEKNRVSKPFNSNTIDKQHRQKRDADDWTVQDNAFSSSDERAFTATIQGAHFNRTLDHTYILANPDASFNYSYSIPISKYMPDDHVYIIFRSAQTSIKDVEYCYNEFERHECLLNGFETEKPNRKKLNENQPDTSPSGSIIFQVDLLGFLSKIMTYRISLRQTQNTCKLSNTKLGLEYLEYNFHFYRHCDE